MVRAVTTNTMLTQDRHQQDTTLDRNTVAPLHRDPRENNGIMRLAMAIVGIMLAAGGWLMFSSLTDADDPGVIVSETEAGVTADGQ